MFREIARKKQQLTTEECIEILKNEKRGVLSVNGDDGYPYGMPMNHYYCEEDGILFFHSGMQGHKVDAMKADDKVSYCVYDQGYLEDGDWALYIKSVIVFGRVKIVEDLERAKELTRKLSYKFTSDAEHIEEEIESAAERTLFFEVIPEHMTGKLVHEI